MSDLLAEFDKTDWEARQAEIEHQMSGVKAYCDEMFRVAYNGLILSLLRHRAVATGEHVPSGWYGEWWRLAEAMEKHLAALKGDTA